MNPRPPTPGFPDRFRVEVERERVATPEELTIPRPARMPQGSSLRPSPEAMVRLWAAARHWSPAGIAAALLIMWFGVGGADGMTKLVGSLAAAMSQSEELRQEVAAMRKEVREFIATERAERSKIRAEVTASTQNLSALCDVVSELNLGKPNATWCSADGRGIRFEAPPPSGVRIPIHKTAAQWSTPEALSHVKKD